VYLLFFQMMILVGLVEVFTRVTCFGIKATKSRQELRELQYKISRL